MTKQLSYTKEEHEIRGNFREMMDLAKSTEDVKKFFYQAVRELLNKVAGQELDIQYEDLRLDLDQGQGYTLSEDLIHKAKLKEVMEQSDLNNILDRLSEKAWNRYRRLEKNPAKTEKKIYSRPPAKR